MNNFTGWQKVFKFTFLQMVKSKAFIISTIIIIAVVMLMSIGINFLPGLLAGGKSSEEGQKSGISESGFAYGIEKLYIVDNSELKDLNFDFLTEEGIQIVPTFENEVEAITEYINGTDNAHVLIEITRNGSYYSVLASRPANNNVSADNCNSILGLIHGALWETHMLSIGVPAQNLGEASPFISTQVTIAGESPKNELASVISSTLPMISALILFMFIFLYGQFTAQSIATEKSSRVIETLLTSVRPMAVILGKVLGMGLASLTQFLALLAATFGISAIVAPFGTLGEVFGSVDISMLDSEMQMVRNAFDETFSSFNAMTIVWVIIIFIFGFLFYSLIAGLFGATVSRMEDFQSAMQPMSLIGVLGFYMAYISPIFGLENDGINIMEKISYYLPISSPFALPGVIISGKMDTIGIVISIAILIAFNLLMLMFVARVYETIILHTGNRIKMKDLFKTFKMNKKK